ncbi:tetraspanin-4-like [Antedon mediterranea]|uniref:tetraspanin-4-like n=1 Tax=Antedon mediterranea TaxID=105859 RepID=UPI003AF4411C
MGICGLRRTKCLLFVFNIILLLSGGGLLGLGIVLKTGAGKWLKIEDLETILNHAKDLLKHSSHLLLAAGSILIFVGAIGCYGICKECQWFLTTYFVVLIIGFCLQVTASILASRALELAKAENNTMLSAFEMIYGNEENADSLKKAWRLAETKFNCCGYNNGTDYNYVRNVSMYYYSDDKKDDGFPDFPESCCVGAWMGKASDPEYIAENPAKCRESWDNNMTRVEDTDFYHGMSCKQKLYNCIYWISGGAIGVAFLELLCMIFVIRLCRNIEHY